MSLSNKPLTTLRVEEDRSGKWRSLVVCDDIVLHCLHRAVQHCSRPSAQDAAIERQEYAFTFRGSKLGKLKSLALTAAPLGEAFLGGGDALKYVAAGAAYTITVGRRGRGDIKHYVPRCIAGSAEADLDATNSKLLVRRYGRNHTNNKDKKAAPPLLCPASATSDWFNRVYMNAMRQPIRDANELLLQAMNA
ncbi:hypothetical protein COHA_004628 [Chlorella ohadii]|uniref:Uncharacterized protein n=1 Tax=Chlorella ohadii TaxID=2649997 RepID=A0AAD5H756_9CHLO|nr:hypothetical protein COHA_004628 [Chlorella ohadii]